MYQETIATLVEAGEHKVTGIRENMVGFFIGAVMAGAYIGFGNIIMYSVTAHVDAAWVRLVSGAVFSAALTIVIFAGSELFTGTAMYMPLAVLSRRATFSQLLGVWATTWLGNLVGAVTLAALFKATGGGVLLGDGREHFVAAVGTKISAPGSELFFKGVLCNWLVCLAIWMCNRTSDASAKIFLIFWPITIFVSAGFEHSVANMFTLSLALMSSGDSGITVIDACRNLFWVTAGNIVGGSIFVACGYWLQEHGIGHEGHAKIAPVEVPAPKTSR
ncbi:formate/nitrite transporter family protein [Rhizobium leguminosarum]|uniref:formate/nitrite transporter family protein n=1 Tax=Rhizobium leguminosarum TaxID=384 RepID=UPI000FEC4A66|nr:formate/nitrite transporter family protein [Rhizobium leguminosarum]RWX36699.1 formate/nitrite transporter family protein [Rhizobium leguminosarum]